MAQNREEKSSAGKPPIYKRKWVWILLAIVLLFTWTSHLTTADIEKTFEITKDGKGNTIGRYKKNLGTYSSVEDALEKLFNNFHLVMRHVDEIKKLKGVTAYLLEYQVTPTNQYGNKEQPFDIFSVKVKANEWAKYDERYKESYRVLAQLMWSSRVWIKFDLANPLFLFLKKKYDIEE